MARNSLERHQRQGKRNFFLLQNVQTGCGTHSTSYPMGTGEGRGKFSGRRVKRPGSEADNSPPCGAQIMNTWSCNATFIYLPSWIYIFLTFTS